MLSKLATSSVNGQFRKPRHIIRMMVDLMRPKVDDTICDPSCDTGGFLIGAEECISEAHRFELLKPENSKHFQGGLFTGFDFDQHMLRIGAMNMMLHGIENPIIEYRDSLSDDGEKKKKQPTEKSELLFIALIQRMLKNGGRATVIVPVGIRWMINALCWQKAKRCPPMSRIIFRIF